MTASFYQLRGENAMDAYAVTAAFDANFASHDWAVANVKGAGLEDDFSTVWPNSKDEDLCLDTFDDVVYFYGGRGAIYKALAPFDQSRIRNFAGGHRSDLIHVFRHEVKVAGGLKKKQIIMLAVADAARDKQLARYRDKELEDRDSEQTYKMRDFLRMMERKWPDIAKVDDD